MLQAPRFAFLRATPRLGRIGTALAVAGALAAILVLPAKTLAGASRVPPPLHDEQAAALPGAQTAVLAGGCFWGIQAVFSHVVGIREVLSGYAGGPAEVANYEAVSTGRTGHAESVRITFDPHEITYGKILQIFFSVAHDPTQLDRQGPDVGNQYRSAIFYQDEAQRHIAEAYLQQLGSAAIFNRPIVTRLDPLVGFYRAEAYHQDYALHHPDNAYIRYNDLPKVENLKRLFPELWRETPVTVAARSSQR